MNTRSPMSVEHAGRLLTLWQANWRGFADDAVAAAMWVAKIRALDQTLGDKVTEALLARCKFPPTIADFSEAVTQARHERWRDTQPRALPEAPVDPEVMRAGLVEARRVIGASKGPLADVLRRTVDTIPEQGETL